jgi:hypothetical protein
MAVYRVYLVHDDGRLQPDESFYCKSDAEAVARLKPAPADDVRAELWQGGRFIATAFRKARAPRSGRNFPAPR